MQIIFSFLTGGLICVLGQLLIDKTKLTPARILTLFVVAGVVLGALGLYQPLEDGFPGIFTGALKSAAGGIGAAIVLSLFAGLIGKSKAKD